MRLPFIGDRTGIAKETLRAVGLPWKKPALRISKSRLRVAKRFTNLTPRTKLSRPRVFRRTKSNDSRFLPERFDPHIIRSNVDFWLFRGTVDRDPNAQEELIDTAGREDIQHSSATRSDVRPLMGYLTGT